MRDVIAQTRSARVTAALYRLGCDADASVIEKQAGLVFVAMLDHVLERRGRGFDIGQDSNGFYARPRSSSVGPARTLRDLRLICRRAIIGKATREEWTVAWAATPESIKRSLWKPRLIETKQKARRAGVWIRHAGIRRDIDSTMLTLGFAAEGFAMQTPKPHIVWPIIAHQFAKISKNPELKTRKRNTEADAAVAAIKIAYRAITGQTGGRGLTALSRELDAVFGTALRARLR